MKDSKYYKKRMRINNNCSDKGWLTKLLLSIIIVLVCLIATNFSVEIKKDFKNYFLEKNIDFGSINSFYKKYVGDVSDIDVNTDDVALVNDQVNLFGNNYEEKDGSYYINVGVDYPLKFLKSGLVVFNGDKENYGNTVIIQGNDGIDTWYSNVLLDGYSLYDYVSEDDLLGSSLKEQVIITFMKDGNKITYEEYIK